MEDYNVQLSELFHLEFDNIAIHMYRPVLIDVVTSFLQHEIDKLLTDLQGGATSTELFGVYSLYTLVKKLKDMCSFREDMFELTVAYSIITAASSQILAQLLSVILKHKFSDILTATTRDNATVESLIFS